MRDKNARCEMEYCGSMVTQSDQKRKNKDIFLVSLHYQSLQIIALLLQACVLEILTSFVRCDPGYLTITLMTFSPSAFGTVKEMKCNVLLNRLTHSTQQ